MRLEARDYIVKLVGEFIESYYLRYIRWDHCSDPYPILKKLDPTLKVCFAHVKGLYEVWDRLREKYPQLMLEACAGGGMRLDLGSMSREHTGYLHDSDWHPHVYHVTQAAANVFVPPYYQGSAIGWPLIPGLQGRTDLSKHPDYGLPDLSFLSRMMGMIFFHGRVAEWTPEMKRRGKRWVQIYKRIRHLMLKDYYRLTSQPQSHADWNAMQFCDGPREGLVFAFRWAGATDAQNLMLQELDTGRTYRFRDEATAQETTFAGKDLIRTGLPVSLTADSAKLYYYKAE